MSVDLIDNTQSPAVTVPADGEINVGNVFNNTDVVRHFTITNNTSNAITNIRVKAYDSQTSKTAYRIILGGNLSNENVYPSMVLASADNVTFVELKGDNAYLTLMPTGTNLDPNNSVDFYLKISIPEGAVIDDQDFALSVEYDNA